MNSINRDWPRALLSAGIDVPLQREEFLISCPFHSDRVPSLSINTCKGVWICHAYPDECGKGSLLSFLSKYLDISLLEADKLAYDDNLSSVDLIEEPHIFSNSSFDLPEVKFPFITECVPRWIFDRGFSSEVLLRWGCGFDRRTESLAIPIYDVAGKTVGWTKRQPEGRFPKYLNSPGLAKSKILFGYSLLDLSKDFICLTEGPLDAIWLNQNGFSAISLMGVFLSNRQEQLLSKILSKEIVLCLDGDEPGRKASEEIYKRLIKYFVVTKISLPVGMKDVQDIRDKEILKTIIDNRTPF